MDALRSWLAQPEVALVVFTAGLLLISIELVKPGKVWPLSAGLVLAGAGAVNLARWPIGLPVAVFLVMAAAALLLPKLPLAIISSLFFAGLAVKLWIPSAKIPALTYVCAAALCCRYGWLAHHGLKARRLKRVQADAQVNS